MSGDKPRPTSPVVDLIITLIGWGIGFLLILGIAGWLRLTDLLWHGLGSLAVGVFVVIVLPDFLKEGSLVSALQRISGALFAIVAVLRLYERYGHCEQLDEFPSVYCGDTAKSWATVLLMLLFVVLGASITHHIGDWFKRMGESRVDPS